MRAQAPGRVSGDGPARTRLELLRRRHGLVPPQQGVRKQKAPEQEESGNMTAYTTTAAVPTEHAGRYLQQICKHWSHDLTVEFTPEHGTVTFPANGRAGSFPGDALVTFDARADALDVRIDASDAEQLAVMRDVVARHLDRFAFREAPLRFDWK